MKSTDHKPRSTFLQIRNGVTDFFRKIQRQPNSQFPHSSLNSTSFTQNSEIVLRPAGEGRGNARLSEFVQDKYVRLAELSVAAAQNPSKTQHDPHNIHKRRRHKRSSRTRSFDNRNGTRMNSNYFQSTETDADTAKENCTKTTVKQANLMPYGDHNEIIKTESSELTEMRSQGILQGIQLIGKMSETQIPLGLRNSYSTSWSSTTHGPKQTDQQNTEVKSEGEILSTISSQQTTWAENTEGDRDNKEEEEWITQEFPLLKGFSHMSVGEIVSSQNIHVDDHFYSENPLRIDANPQSVTPDQPQHTRIIQMDLQSQSRIEKEQKDEDDIKYLIKTLEKKLSKNKEQSQVKIDSNEKEEQNVITHLDQDNFNSEAHDISVESETNEPNVQDLYGCSRPCSVTKFNCHITPQLNSGQRQNSSHLDEYIQNAISKTSPVGSDSSFPRRFTVIPQLPPELETASPQTFYFPPIKLGPKIITAVVDNKTENEEQQLPLIALNRFDTNCPLDTNSFSFSDHKTKTPKMKWKETKELDSETKSRIILAKKDRGPFWRIDMFERNRAKNKKRNGAYAVTFGIKLKKSIPQQQRRRRRRRGQGGVNFLRLLNTRKNRKLNKMKSITGQESGLLDDYPINLPPHVNFSTTNGNPTSFYPSTETKFRTDPFLHSTGPLKYSTNSYSEELKGSPEINQDARDNYSWFYNNRVNLDRAANSILSENPPHFNPQSKSYSHTKNKTRYDKISLAPILENSSKISSKTKTLLATLVNSNPSDKLPFYSMDNSNFNHKNQYGFGMSKKSILFDEKILKKIYTPKTDFTRQFQFLLPSSR